MIDLTHVHWKPNRFGGSESKWTIEFDGKLKKIQGWPSLCVAILLS